MAPSRRSLEHDWRAWRLGLRMTQVDAALALGVSLSAYRGYEAGRINAAPPNVILALYVAEYGLLLEQQAPISKLNRRPRAA